MGIEADGVDELLGDRRDRRDAGEAVHSGLESARFSEVTTHSMRDGAFVPLSPDIGFCTLTTGAKTSFSSKENSGCVMGSLRLSSVPRHEYSELKLRVSHSDPS